MDSPTQSQQQQSHDSSQPGTPNTPGGDSASEQSPSSSADPKKKRTGPKRRKVTHACVYCRRSHMTCDDGRPCQRCIKRSIGHMCHDEAKNPSTAQSTQSAKRSSSTSTPVTTAMSTNGVNPANNNYMSLANMSGTNGTNTNLGGLPLQFFGQMGTGQLTFASEHMGNEISVIRKQFGDSILMGVLLAIFLIHLAQQQHHHHQQHQQHQNHQTQPNTPTSAVNTAEKFFLTAADPSDGKLEDRLTEVINAKYEAGFLKPYNYVNGYARLQKYMDNNMSASSRQRILNVMGTFRPAFRSVAQSLTDIDLILVEEAFERLLLDYDRVFSSMGIPACLWRRTGEIYKGNKEFASLVNVPIETLREGRLCIYELMAEESAVNYWEKYGNIAFDPGQKAVLTSCLLKSPDPENTSVISCCFSFTIRRDKYNIPTVIVGNFLPVQLQ
ncbi:Zn(2)-C6 fungal-specific transcription factor [Phycomyces blakesleeanus NRRL 1555(-)]|uniref:Zn(2)-C6 fungal-specific transcription factor n=1 Tax=Phycomyces blakesleeanus (strain ATCC 8743b / DSM 1359 / FGSC 10004 / NBRC 33097 / NRRL 1555) TaxID=763407 RepID=A0A163D8D0_PHYB8|nr:Zn(2)-C6 fungal-specific transcription factor [Phycomyces blakesleeanus NRRL 1555(-)]OAD69500.1 Zn(2)-C6 fungal-specific transcription factor [Phycomyces blakesleeanus NRRL 1555(-)]|eukprot:XP_018287540.1 Zn(2)-C6 fungal-specific transcription factor [Phycomyces blakesleeanus NRRL 1555(-)]